MPFVTELTRALIALMCAGAITTFLAWVVG